MYIIRNRFTKSIITESDHANIRELCCENKMNLSRADLSRADLSGADLFEADLSGADLSRAKLYGVNLYGANLSGAKLFETNYQISMLLHSIDWGELSDTLTLELMRRDALICDVDKMNAWVNEDGNCPFSGNIIRDFYFLEKKKVWKPGNPKLNDKELFIALCQEKNIQISIV